MMVLLAFLAFLFIIQMIATTSHPPTTMQNSLPTHGGKYVCVCSSYFHCDLLLILRFKSLNMLLFIIFLTFLF